MEATVDASGLHNLEDFFKDLSAQDQRKIFMTAYRTATKPLVDRAKQTVPKGKTGNLQRSVGTIAVPQEVAIMVGTKKGGGFKGWHGHLIEDGTAERMRTTKSGKKVSTGRIIGSHFFTQAYDATIGQVIESVQQSYEKAIQSTVKRHNKRFNTR